MRGKVAQQPGEDLQFQFFQPRLRAQNLALQLLERGGREAFRPDQRLLALIVRRRAVRMRLGDFDVVAEDLVVADLQRRDPRPLTFRRFQSRDHSARVQRQPAHLVNLGAEAGADGIAVARIHRRLVADRRIDLRGDLGQRAAGAKRSPESVRCVDRRARRAASPPPRAPARAAARRAGSRACCRYAQPVAPDRRCAAALPPSRRRDRPRTVPRPRHAARESRRDRAADRRSSSPAPVRRLASASSSRIESSDPVRVPSLDATVPDDAG